MGWFGGPSIADMAKKMDYAGLIDIVVEGKKADQVERATAALHDLGSEATAHVIGKLVGPDRLEKEAQARLRAVAKSDSDTSLPLLLAPVVEEDHRRAFKAVVELGEIGGQRAIPVLAGYLARLEAIAKGAPDFFGGDQPAGMIIARVNLFTRSAAALFKLGVDGGVPVLLRLMRDNPDNLVGMMTESALEDMTGQEFECDGGIDVAAWLEWWAGCGRSVDERLDAPGS